MHKSLVGQLRCKLEKPFSDQPFRTSERRETLQNGQCQAGWSHRSD